MCLIHAAASFPLCLPSFFFFNDPATTEIYPLSLPDALPICPDLDRRHGTRGGVGGGENRAHRSQARVVRRATGARRGHLDRKSTRLNSSHSQISYAVFCLKKSTLRRRNRSQFGKEQ